jgi:hypothetical protein
VHADYLGFMPPQLRVAASSDPQTWVATWGSSEQIPETQNCNEHRSFRDHCDHSERTGFRATC